MVALQVSLFVVVASVVMQYFFWVSGLVSRTSLRQSGSDIGVGGRDTLRGTLGRLSEMMWSQLGITRSGQATTTTSSGRLGSLITGCWVEMLTDACKCLSKKQDNAIVVCNTTLSLGHLELLVLHIIDIMQILDNNNTPLP